jgi:small-conductance mechanosensitive channel
MVKQAITNLSYPKRLHFKRLTIGVEYGIPPNRVKEALFRAVMQVPGVERPIQKALKMELVS